MLKALNTEFFDENDDDDEDKDDDDDEEYEIFMFEQGRWNWDAGKNQLEFLCNKKEDVANVESKRSIIQTMYFFEDKDVTEKIRFAKKFQRKIKPNEQEIVTLQDIKDVVMFTASKKIMNIYTINAIHTNSFDNFLRALIVYIKFFIRVYCIMINRIQIGENKISLPVSNRFEQTFADDLSDLRAVVAKEYSFFMFEDKNVKRRQSTSYAEAATMDHLLKFIIQMVWITFRRRYFEFIELEVKRLFNSMDFNWPSHKSSIEPRIQLVLYGHLQTKERLKTIQGTKRIKSENKMESISPLFDALLKYSGDSGLMGINRMGFESSDERLEFMEDVFSAPEELLSSLGIRLGILGKPRNMFDEFLVPLKIKDDSKYRSEHLSEKMFDVYSTSTAASRNISSTYIPVVSKKYEYPVASFDIPPKYKRKYYNREQRPKWIMEHLKLK